MDLNLAGRTVLITGASKGIGAAAAEAFAEEGCHLILAARSAEALDALCERLSGGYGVQARAVPTDLRDPAQLAALAEAGRDADVLVNNAGDIPGGTLEDVDEARWRHAWELKVFGYINLTRAIYAHMKARGRGVIVNDIGAAGERMDASYIAGSTGNAALYAFTRALGGRALRDGVRVVGVSPGPVETDRLVARMKAAARTRFGDETRFRELMAGYPLGRAAKPREIADLMAFLASDRSAYTTGVVFTVDGGFSANPG
ncbi:short-chain dehydrogenase/reductase [Phenylobacterium sp. SCN 70-31]|uniref:short-chain dehydrogenase/reductase n=1 Tax=Phenylobacterium sp. SCN 70-31 TaxID=1660129 RepID=UPI000869FCB1|nr:short-chain dehydrogenase/reductase [Phenylobacterium sp. SCN 70-31]ODT87652.1 MAG: short-chain dehydrogenase [Phenylobacterium sp. SCN 70-31]